MAFTGQKRMATSTLQYATVAAPTASQWVTVNDALMGITISGFDRQVGSAFVAGQDYPVQAPGKRNGGTVDVNFLYGEGSTGATGLFTVVRTQYELAAGGPLPLRWTVAGTGSSSNFRWTTSTSGTFPTIITNPGYPQGSVGPGEPIANTFTVSTPYINTGTA